MMRAEPLPTGYSVLPLPHPLDYEWRFTVESARRLLDQATDMSQHGEMVLLLGTPGVAMQALLRSRDCSMTFLGDDNVVTNRLSALNRQIDGTLSVERCVSDLTHLCGAGVVIVDPPWYLDFIVSMLKNAATLCKLNGHLLVSLPPEGARPSAAEDRSQVFRVAFRLGLRCVETHILGLAYETPFFEDNALKASDCELRCHWRRGDLIVFRKVVDVRPMIHRTPPTKHWRDTAVGRIRLFVRRGVPDGEGQPLQGLIQGDILPTVSRRDRRRASVHLWTSGNRVFTSSSPGLVIAAAIAASNGLDGTVVYPDQFDSRWSRDEIQRCAIRGTEIESAQMSTSGEHIKAPHSPV